MMTILWLLLGLLVGSAFLAYTRRWGKERRVVALGLLTAALIYLGFALFRGGPVWIVAELLGVGTYGLLAWMGLRRSPLWLAGGWALHPVWDVGVHLIATEGSPAPAWYIIACISFDLLVAGGVAMRFRLTPEGST